MGSAVEEKSSQRYFYNIFFYSLQLSSNALMDSGSRFGGSPELITALIFLFRFLSRKKEKETIDY
ncbi:hypothetical protein [Persicobacter sp. CCB-QB2]|uniref:hypothetical protein n=1 Tax=Persicobacter sp. CCB-QB2 TaxID=1561025 RepID=UPI0012F8EE17|nr:hypothetical protein [Persicobacter sp. CCB-QB2]